MSKRDVSEDLSRAIKKAFAESPKMPALPKMSAEEQVKRLREYLNDYNNTHRFSVGSLVTPKADGDMKGHGRPYIVLEINPDAEPILSPEFVHTNGFGPRFAVRVMTMQPRATAYWCEAHVLEPWTPDMLPEEKDDDGIRVIAVGDLNGETKQ